MRPTIILLFIFFISCQTKPEKNHLVVSESIMTTIEDDTFAETLGDNSENSEVIKYIWAVNFEKRTKTNNPDFRKEFLNEDTLIRGINILYPDIILSKIRISGDTLFTEIKDSEYLGERIGSNGALSYIAYAVINLTSIKNINFVKINFDDGSHISLGVWSKREFINYKEVN